VISFVCEPSGNRVHYVVKCDGREIGGGFVDKKKLSSEVEKYQRKGLETEIINKDGSYANV